MTPFIGQNVGEEKKKVFAYQSVGFRSQKKKTNKKQMVSPRNGDTQGRPPPLATPLRLTSVQVASSFKQTNNTPATLRFFGRPKNLLRKHFIRSFWREPNFVRGRAI